MYKRIATTQPIALVEW